jgi:trk system potassium uptake protein TrkH
LLLLLGGALLVPVIGALVLREPQHAPPFLMAALGSGALGAVTVRLTPSGPLSGRESAIVCTFGWVVCSLIGAVPCSLLSGLRYRDAVFETISGFTTTGFTLLRGLEDLPRTLLLWRALTQFVGGLGILTFFLLVAFQGSATHRLFSAEGRGDAHGRPTPGLWGTLLALWRIYLVLFALAVVVFRLVGMDLFDALTHGFTVASTGGFSNYDTSLGHFEAVGHPRAAAIQWACTALMLTGGISYLVYYRLCRRDWAALLDRCEVRAYVTVLVVVTLLVAAEHVLKVRSAGAPWRSPEYLEFVARQSAFSTVAMSATGYVSRDLNGHFFFGLARLAFIVLMVIGGCTGSTAGGLKVLRVLVLQQTVWRRVRRIHAPQRAVNPLVLDGRRIDEAQVDQIAGLLYVVAGLVLLGGALTALFTHHGPFEALSGMASAVGNIGPCFLTADQIIALPWAVKGVYILGMLAGRLEVFPVLMVFSRSAWRRRPPRRL